jgi:hypothetical protein
MIFSMAGRKRQRRSATEAPRGVPYGTDPAGKIQPGLFLCTERFKRRARARRRSNPPPAGCSPSDKLHHSTAGEAVLLYCEAARATLGPDEPYIITLAAAGINSLSYCPGYPAPHPSSAVNSVYAADRFVWPLPRDCSTHKRMFSR